LLHAPGGLRGPSAAARAARPGGAAQREEGCQLQGRAGGFRAFHDVGLVVEEVAVVVEAERAGREVLGEPGSGVAGVVSSPATLKLAGFAS
jgi:hypothetical protein